MIATTLGTLLLAAGCPTQDPTPTETFGAEANPTGQPLGGGEGYGRTITEEDFTVRTAPELLSALRQARTGQVIYVDDRAQIDLTGQRSLTIPSGVTLASGRGSPGAAGGLLFSTEDCEIWGFSHGGVFLRRGTGARIHHNSIHHCQRSGLGYGVVLDVAEALIEANVFDWCRHAIAGTGRPGSGYEARYNLVLEHANGHSFDMHGGRDRKDGTEVAGDWLKIHHNTFRAASVYAVVIRGRPRQEARVHHNWFPANDTVRAVQQKNAKGNLRVGRNLFGSKD